MPGSVIFARKSAIIGVEFPREMEAIPVKGFNRAEPLFSLCGLQCALCPMHLDGHCPGCGGGAGNQSCAIARCSLEQGGVAFCTQCARYPCEWYDGFDACDSFGAAPDPPAGSGLSAGCGAETPAGRDAGENPPAGMPSDRVQRRTAQGPCSGRRPICFHCPSCVLCWISSGVSPASGSCRSRSVPGLRKPCSGPQLTGRGWN